MLVEYPTNSPNSVMSGVITVTTAGTAVKGPNVYSKTGFMIKALSTNTGLGYIGNDGAADVASTTGYELTADQPVLTSVSNLSDLWFDTSVNGEKFCWIKA